MGPENTLKTISDNSVIGTVTAHIHQTDYSYFHDICHFSINAFSKETPDKAFTGTYSIIDVDVNHITVQVYTTSSGKIRSYRIKY